jgi:hypothetical protein
MFSQPFPINNPQYDGEQKNSHPDINETPFYPRISIRYASAPTVA